MNWKVNICMSMYNNDPNMYTHAWHINADVCSVHATCSTLCHCFTSAEVPFFFKPNNGTEINVDVSMISSLNVIIKLARVNKLVLAMTAPKPTRFKGNVPCIKHLCTR